MSGNKEPLRSPPVSRYELLFITAHLAAGHPNVEERNSDYRTIVESTPFPERKRLSAVTSESPPSAPFEASMTGMPQGTWSGWETQITG